MDDDFQLLRRYATERCEAAFAELVRRHAGLVYAAALRRLHGRHHPGLLRCHRQNSHSRPAYE